MKRFLLVQSAKYTEKVETMGRVLFVLAVFGVFSSADYTCFDQRDGPEEFKNCGGDRYAGLPFSTRSPVLSQHGMVASQQPLAVDVAINVLKSGGNAVDAAVALNAAISVMEPGMNGAGGDLYAIIWDPKTERLYGLNGSGRSSHSVRFEDMEALLEGAQFIPSMGPLSVSIPGACDAWFELNDRFGTKPMAELLQPAVDYAENGIPFHQVAAADLEDARLKMSNPSNVEILTMNGRYPNNVQPFFDTFMKPDGTAPKHGEVFRNPSLAETFRQLQEGGRDAFYRGEIAEKLAEHFRNAGIPLSYEDLATHTSTWVEPMSVNYRGWDVWEIPPNGQGIAALQMLNVLEGYNLTAMGHNSADYLHVHVAAKQLAYADRAKFYSDADFNDLDYSYLLSKSYAEERRRLIDMENAFVTLDGGDPFPEQSKRLQDGDTIFAVIGDNDGMMISLIQSNFANHGSGLTVPGLGFSLQNRGSLFAMDREHYNVFESNKRPFHTLIPAFVTKDGKPLMAFGLKGGAMQAMGHAQVITNMVDFGLNVQEAGDAARYYHAGSNEPTGFVMTDGGLLSLESGIGEEVRIELERRGHRLGATNPETGAVYVGAHQAILWDEEEGVYWGASEMRYDGHARGY